MNMISTGAFLNEMDASNKQPSTAEKFAAVWEKKNAKAARAGGVSLMALSLAACGSSSTTDTTTDSSSDTTTVTPATDAAKTIALTKSSVSGVADVAVGGSGDDLILGTVAGTFETGDSVDGGAGTDTLKIGLGSLTAASTTYGTDVTGVENVEVRYTHDGATADAVTLNMAGFEGAEKVTLYHASSSGSTADSVFTVTGGNFTTAVDLEIVGGDSGADNSSVDVTATYASTTGTADSTDLLLNGAGANVVTIDAIETLNITATSTDTSVSSKGYSSINSLTADDAKTVYINADSKLTLGATDFAATVTVDGSASTGILAVSLDGSSKVTFTGGSGADDITIGAIANLTTDDQIDGGDGVDELITSATSLSAGNITRLGADVENVEILTFSATSAVTLDMDTLDHFDHVKFTGAKTAAAGTGASAASAGNTGSDAQTVTGIEAGDEITITAAHVGGAGETIAVTGTTTTAASSDGGDGGDALVLTPDIDTGSDAITVTLSANLTGGDGGNQTTTASGGSGGDGGDAIAAGSFETINLVTSGTTAIALAGGSAGTGGASSDSGNDGFGVVANTNATINVSGTANLDLGTISGTNVNVDASDFAKVLTIVGSATANNITGGSGADVINGAGGQDILTGGAGADRFIIGLGATTTASDAQAASSGTTPHTAFEKITDFAVGSDKIHILTAADGNASLTIEDNASSSTGTAAINSEGIASFAAADDTLSERITAVEAGINAGGSASAGDFAVFEHGGNSYIFVSDGTDNVAVGDIVVMLEGVTGLSDTTIDSSGYLTIA